jgi:hypothetical protein
MSMAVSSASIPVYLHFGCGHEAMVSLPRVRGESAGERTLRIAHEKAMAGARACDFCPPLATAEPVEAPVAMAEPVEAAAEELTIEAVIAAMPEELLTIVEPAPAPTPSANGRATARPRGRPRGTSRRQAPVAAATVGIRFRIGFVMETVLEAETIHDAVNQAESLGAVDIWSVIRLA